MLDSNPQTRITAAEVLQHKWLTASPPELVASVSGEHPAPTWGWALHRRSKICQEKASLLVALGKHVGEGLRSLDKHLSPRSVAQIYKDFAAYRVVRENPPPPPSPGGREPHPFHPRVSGINKTGFKALLVKEGVEEAVADRLVSRIFSQLDINGDGLVMWKEFVALLPLLASGPLTDLYPKPTLRIFWDLWAEEHSPKGRESSGLSHDALFDLLTFTHAVGKDYIEDTIHSILDTADSNHDGLLSFEDFVAALAVARKGGEREGGSGSSSEAGASLAALSRGIFSPGEDIAAFFGEMEDRG